MQRPEILKQAHTSIRRWQAAVGLIEEGPCHEVKGTQRAIGNQFNFSSGEKSMTLAERVEDYISIEIRLLIWRFIHIGSGNKHGQLN